MALSCIRCGSALTGGRFCSDCGAEQQKPSKEADPSVGQTIGDRYEVGELIGVGGMGRIHRGLQRSLDRPVAIKFIHPHLMTSELAVKRFMMEARAASRLNHPNVVSVFDFGRTSSDEGGELYLVMELLSGSNLSKVMESEGLLPLHRTVEILRQTLLALSEAHRRGVTHRDVKPENIFLERYAGDTDHVKVIDFGIAGVSGHDISQSGQIIGTPAYMAPEQVMDEETGAYTDLYAVGVILFEMLVGRLPFEGSMMTVCQKHIGAPRPNPRALALDHDIPDELALLCMRALAIDPADRPGDAETFAEELVRAVRPRPSSGERPPLRKSAPSGAGASNILHRHHEMADTEPSINPPPPQQWGPTLSLRPLAAPSSRSLSLAGREDTLSWSRALIEEPRDLAAILLWGRPGIGKTRLLQEMRAEMELRSSVHNVLIAPAPLSEVGNSSLRRIILELSGIPSGDRILALGQSKRGKVAEGLRAIFGSPLQNAPEGSQQASIRELTDALTWAAHRAIERSTGGRAILVLDDIDAMDGSSLAAVSELLRDPPIPGFLVVGTSERCPATLPDDRVAHQQLQGLRRDEAILALRAEVGLHDLDPCGDDIEPLYLEHWNAWRAESILPPPESLTGLVAARIKRLPPEQLRTLHALAVMGCGSLGSIASAMPRPEDLDIGLKPLCLAGFAFLEGSTASLLHALFGQIALATAPEAAVAQLHMSAAASIESARDLIELRAYHTLRGSAGLDSFLLLEEAANLRTARGDIEGAIAVLYDAVRAARIQIARGEEYLAASAWAIFGRKLSSALLSAQRPDEAYGVLIETIDASHERDASRALVLEQLAIVALHRGQTEEAKRRWSEALSIAEQRADYALVQRFRRPIPSPPSSTKRPPILRSRISVR